MSDGLDSLLQGLGDLGSVFLNYDLFLCQDSAQLDQDQHIGGGSLQHQEASSVRIEDKAEGAASKPSLSKRSRRPSKSVEEELRSKLNTLKALACQNQLLQVWTACKQLGLQALYSVKPADECTCRSASACWRQC
jgi:hypothetical protein